MLFARSPGCPKLTMVVVSFVFWSLDNPLFMIALNAKWQLHSRERSMRRPIFWMPCLMCPQGWHPVSDRARFVRTCLCTDDLRNSPWKTANTKRSCTLEALRAALFFIASSITPFRQVPLYHWDDCLLALPYGRIYFVVWVSHTTQVEHLSVLLEPFRECFIRWLFGCCR